MRQSLVSLDDAEGEKRYRFEPADPMDPEKLYERRWALTVLEQARDRLKQEYLAGGKCRLYERVSALEAGDPNAPSYAQAAIELSCTENTVKSHVFRLRQRYRELVREEVANTVGTPAEVDEEIRHLIGAIGG